MKIVTVVLLLGGGARALSRRASISPPWARSGWIVAGVAALGAVMIGHLLGGPDPDQREAVAAAASAMRFPALALVLAAAMPGGNTGDTGGPRRTPCAAS